MKSISLLTGSLSMSANSHLATTPLEVVEHYMAAWNQHDAHKAASFLTSDVTLYDAAVGTPVKGRVAAEKHVIQAFIDGVPDLQWKMTSKPIFNHDTIAFQWQFSGTNTGSWSGHAATNKPIKFEGVSFIRVEHGKIIYQGDYYDSASLSQQLK